MTEVGGVKSCSDILECAVEALNDCHDNGSCIEEVGTYDCTCNTGQCFKSWKSILIIYGLGIHRKYSKFELIDVQMLGLIIIDAFLLVLTGGPSDSKVLSWIFKNNVIFILPFPGS